MFTVSEAWKNAFPGAMVGVLVMHDVQNPDHHPELESCKEALEEEIRQRFAGQDRKAIAALPAIQAYSTYYKRFNKSYHVQLQIESIAFKGKHIPSVAALVETMFMAELEHMLLTAGHALASTRLPLRLDVSKGDETYRLLRGQDQVLKAGDMMIADEEGIISSVIYGPDERTQISPATKDVVFTIYAPNGIERSRLQGQLAAIRQNVLLIAPQAQTELEQIYSAA